MGKKSRLKKIDFDLQFGIDAIIPSTQQGFHDGKFNYKVRKTEKKCVPSFNLKIIETLNNLLENKKQFPTKNEVFIFIAQFLISKQEYKIRDIDNMAKSILDMFKNKIYLDDGQVKVLLVCKELNKQRIPQSFAYFAVKEIKNHKSPQILKIAGIEKAVTYYNTLKRNKGK